MKNQSHIKVIATYFDLAKSMLTNSPVYVLIISTKFVLVLGLREAPVLQ